MLLYTAHAAEPLPDLGSVAESTGLERRLGYRPLFCTLLNPDSLADSWFRAYAASPSYVQVIDVYEVDDKSAQPMDVVTWCDECLGSGEPDDDALTRALAPEGSDFTDYLLDPDAAPLRSWRFDVLDILNGRLDDLALGSAERAALQHSMESVRALPSREDVRLGSSLGGNLDQIPLEMWYRFMLTVSLMPLVWSQVTGTRVSPWLLSLVPDALGTTPGFQEAQAYVSVWDQSIGEREAFGHERFAAMRACFLRGLDQMAGQLVQDRARAEGVGRNDECFCGSGRKFKKCCARKGLDSLACLV